MGIDIKSIGTLIDELSVVNLKIFWALEKAQEAKLSGDKESIGEHYGTAQGLNSKRSKLIRAIDVRLGEEDLAPSGKTF